jgi:hypothetical protein
MSDSQPVAASEREQKQIQRWSVVFHAPVHRTAGQAMTQINRGWFKNQQRTHTATASPGQSGAVPANFATSVSAADGVCLWSPGTSSSIDAPATRRSHVRCTCCSRLSFDDQLVGLAHLQEDQLRQLSMAALQQAALKSVRRQLSHLTIDVAGGTLRTIQFVRSYAIVSGSSPSPAQLTPCELEWSHDAGDFDAHRGRPCEHHWTVKVSGGSGGPGRRRIFDFSLRGNEVNRRRAVVLTELVLEEFDLQLSGFARDSDADLAQLVSDTPHDSISQCPRGELP